MALFLRDEFNTVPPSFELEDPSPRMILFGDRDYSDPLRLLGCDQFGGIGYDATFRELIELT